MVSDKKSLRKHGNLLKIVAIVSVIVLGVLLCSYLFPNARYGYRTLFVDSKTHYYGDRQSFQYGNFEMTFSSTSKTLGIKTDCPVQSKSRADENTVMPNTSGLIRLFACPAKQTYQQCWQNNYDTYLASCNASNQEIDQNELLDVQISIKNTSNTVKILSKNWFKVEVDSKVLDSNSAVNYYLKDNIGPGEVSSNALNFKVSKNLAEKTRVIVTLPDLAPQIVDLGGN